MILGCEGIGIGTKGVRAELYKLNVGDLDHLDLGTVVNSRQVYSGPSGKFDAHVDTPSGADKFGSLVVCLPCSHTGRLLRI